MFDKLNTGFKEKLIFDLNLQEGKIKVKRIPYYLRYIILSLVFFKCGVDKERNKGKKERYLRTDYFGRYGGRLVALLVADRGGRLVAYIV